MSQWTDREYKMRLAWITESWKKIPERSRKQSSVSPSTTEATSNLPIVNQMWLGRVGATSPDV